MRKSLTGFSILELTVVLIVIAVLAAIAISKLFPIQVDAERASVENVIGGLRSAIGIKVASYIAKDDVADVRRLVGSNPMDLLSEPPRNYLGTVSAAEMSGVPTGEWYFDIRAGVLAYRVVNAGYFRGGSGPPAEARFAVAPVYEDRNHNGRFDAGDMIQGVRLEAVQPYSWTP